MKRLLLSVFVVFFSISPVYAQQADKKFKDWSVYTMDKDGQKLCYTVSYPINKTGNYRKRSQPYVMVTSVGGAIEEFSVTGGYSYKKNTRPRVKIDSSKYKLSLTSGEIAWPKSESYERQLIQKMVKGLKMKVTGTSKRGTYSIDTYSLKGFGSAFTRIKELCDSAV